MIPGLSDESAQLHSTISRTYTIGGKTFIFESGLLARLANGSCVICDDVGNYLLTTAGLSPQGKAGATFFPLTVEYTERYYATGKIGGNKFSKREARPSETAILNSRLIDRPTRPLFPKGVQNEVQIIATILSSSGESDYGFWGITGASLALLLAGVDGFEGPTAGVRIALTPEGKYVFDPSFEVLSTALLDLTIAGTADAITMVESQAQEVNEQVIIQALEYAHSLVRDLCAAQKDFLEFYSKSHEIPVLTLTCKTPDISIESQVEVFVTEEMVQPLFLVGKMEFHEALETLEEATISHCISLDEAAVLDEGMIRDLVYSRVKTFMRAQVLATGKRLDGRSPTQVRPLRSSVAILPRTHGSGLFERGMTQVLSVATLGGPGDIQIVDDLYSESTKRYIHHYNFPPYSVGEVRMLRGVGRREVGHGRLAEKALEPVLPNLAQFPYFIRVVSETLTCNGSSSMASICGSSLALMDAGVPITRPVAGVAMGMVYDTASEFCVLSDIQAQEDFLGDLDFKIAASEVGITALQMDCKIDGLTLAVLSQVFAQSGSALSEIRAAMTLAIVSARPTLSPYAPVILSIFVPEAKMREVIGKGGETIQGIEKEFGVEVNLADSGECSITAKDGVSGARALEFIKGILKTDEVGDILTGKVVKILEGVGAIVEWAKGKSGMMHISKLGVTERVEDISKYITLGQEVTVKIIAIDTEKGRVGLERIITL